MPVVMINKKNISEHTKKVKVLQRFRFEGRAVLPGEVVVLAGHELYDLLSRKLVEIYKEPAPVISNDDPVISNDAPVISNDREKSKRTRKSRGK